MSMLRLWHAIMSPTSIIMVETFCTVNCFSQYRRSFQNLLAYERWILSCPCFKFSWRWKNVIVYNDGDIKTLSTCNERWRSSEFLVTCLVSFLKLCSVVAEVLCKMLQGIVSKDFFILSRTRLPSACPFQSLWCWRRRIHEACDLCTKWWSPCWSKCISSHTAYKIKSQQIYTLRHKARFASHGNEGSFKCESDNDCAMCPSLGFGIVVTVSKSNRSIVVCADVKAALRKNSKACQDVDFCRPRESKDINYY